VITFDNEDVSADVTFLDDDAALDIVDRVHSVNDLLCLAVVEVLHEVVAQDRLRQQLLCPACNVINQSINQSLNQSITLSEIVPGSRSLYALRVLRYYGLTDVCLHTVFRSVVVAKLLYACTAWSGFITASDRHRVDAFLRRSKRCGYCHPDLPTFNELLEDSDDRLFHKLCSNTGHSLHYLLPSPTTASQHYNLRCTSTHNRQLPVRTGHLTDGNFITRLLYKDCY